MGIELVLGAVAAAASVVTGVMQLNEAKKASKARKEANNIQNAQQKNDAADQRRKAIREARVRRAMIVQQSENAGLGIQGSGTQGAVGVVGTNLGSNIAQASGQTLAIEGINRNNQKAADHDFKAQQWGAFGNIFATALGSFQTAQPKAPSYDFPS